MSFQVRWTDSEKWEVAFSDEPSHIHALEMAPESMESVLSTGLWLVVAFPVWSAPVRESVCAAVSCAREGAGRFQLGVRPFDSHDEIYKWWPVAEYPAAAEAFMQVCGEAANEEVHVWSDPSATPIWLVLRDGQAVYQGAGPRSKEQLSELVAALL
jgi:hypothetical protein